MSPASQGSSGPSRTPGGTATEVWQQLSACCVWPSDPVLTEHEQSHVGDPETKALLSSQANPSPAACLPPSSLTAQLSHTSPPLSSEASPFSLCLPNLPSLLLSLIHSLIVVFFFIHVPCTPVSLEGLGVGNGVFPFLFLLILLDVFPFRFCSPTPPLRLYHLSLPGPFSLPLPSPPHTPSPSAFLPFPLLVPFSPLFED